MAFHRSTLVLMSHACLVSTPQTYFCAAHISLAPCPRNQLKAKDTGMTQALLLRYAGEMLHTL